MEACSGNEGVGGPVWKKARKRPLLIEFREPIPSDKVMAEIVTGHKAEMIETLGGAIFAVPGRDFVIKGVAGELYPIRRDIFAKTYQVEGSILSQVRTVAEILVALAGHEANMKVVLNSPRELKETAQNMQWTEDRVRGYMEGVAWTYKWVLGENKDAPGEN